MITDTIVYIYNKKNKELTKHKIKSDIIKENKIYNINKSIKALNTIIDNNIKTKLFKTKIIFLLSKNISPAEKYCFDKVFNNIQNINYSTVNIESLIEDNKEIIIFDDLIYTKTKSINVTNDNELKEMFKKNKYILVGNSTKFNKYFNKLKNILKKEILEYENNETILFERV